MPLSRALIGLPSGRVCYEVLLLLVLADNTHSALIVAFSIITEALWVGCRFLQGLLN